MIQGKEGDGRIFSWRVFKSFCFLEFSRVSDHHFLRKVSMIFWSTTHDPCKTYADVSISQQKSEYVSIRENLLQSIDEILEHHKTSLESLTICEMCTQDGPEKSLQDLHRISSLI